MEIRNHFLGCKLSTETKTKVPLSSLVTEFEVYIPKCMTFYFVYDIFPYNLTNTFSLLHFIPEINFKSLYQTENHKQ